MVTALFLLALSSMAVMGLFLWWLTRRHRRAEAARQARGEDVTVVKDEAPEIETFNPDSVFEEGAAPAAEGEADGEKAD